MLAYLATKEQFLSDAYVIEDKVRDAVKANLGIGVSPNEVNSWRNSLGNAMVHVMSSSKIPADAGVAYTGGGGGGHGQDGVGSSARGGAGGSGIVIIRYLT